MPHIIIDYSRGAAERVAIDELTKAVHHRVRDGALVKPTAVRTFAREATFSCVGDEHPDNHFIQIILRIAPGRSADIKRELLKAVLEAARDIAAPALQAGRLGLRADLYESDPDFAFQELAFA
ncbi:5-carboxymethyl-2-hydroxymuconate Delta-isomerase [Rhizobium hidalgonense]|uniref:5-carboxymethyl-2-hydroxymuconate Delta-isomerase n=1 Tax=Rhizobium hidalgonense TaxID=1538159 RepID=A0A2A6KLN7_9HYPH|nr:5-carboxymethyl-2-hydroxymuconate Delta-isomerase [Rhizobium hidalgonense]EJC73394.1 5-carboxymethyl-2-hydroxymuconate isomerase [Rhizobium leguminosarum bv. trifolii WSM2012]MDR9771315.1 5-carboxymethyl-2-hydroxymuconate Delta-isomerase [Rhizobium hidalgonense]MDR9803637.1 5-carboxymethyl-2-hydroxymuconate Delta-isomerase [Rhizobium hidalgonense]MDR9809130.1 5-carboxymethyl-2-hydroxymuconate Delta-isomerase [Rhizobium hidalgonense]MDR9818655.1 5-carboxymethyl-2-hydroxymuconate Delta-isomer